MRHLWAIFNIIAGLTSIASFLFAIFNNAKYATLSFHLFLASMFLSYIFFKIYDITIIRKEKFQNIVLYYRWIIFNEKESKFDAFRVIKSNRPYLPSIELNQTWSGSGDINIIARDNLAKCDHEGSNISIKYPVSLYMNELKAIGYTVETVDKSGKQRSYLRCGGKNRADLIILEIVLPDKSELPAAKIYRTEKDKPYYSGKPVNKVKFDRLTKSYHWEILGFPGDCDYWLVWDEDNEIHD